MKYCHNCDWTVETRGEFPHQKPSQQALEHFLETGHTVDSKDSFTRLPRRPVSDHVETQMPVLSAEMPRD